MTFSSHYFELKVQKRDMPQVFGKFLFALLIEAASIKL